MNLTLLKKKLKHRMPQVKTAHSQEGHFYLDPNTQEKYSSVTGRLQILKDPAIQNWKKNRALEYIEQNWNSARNYQPEDISKILADASQAPEIEFETAGSIGTDVHNFRHNCFKLLIEGGILMPLAEIYKQTPDHKLDCLSALRGIDLFMKEHNYVPLLCEVPLVDDKLKLGGCTDDIGIVDGELSLIDIKTSNRGWKIHFGLQVALYYYMFVKTFHIKPKKVYILHLSKENGTYNLIPLTNMPFLIRTAKKVIQIANAIDLISDEKKIKSIPI